MVAVVKQVAVGHNCTIMWNYSRSVGTEENNCMNVQEERQIG